MTDGQPVFDVLLFDLVGVLVQLSDEVNAQFATWTGMDEDQFWANWLRSPTVREFDAGRIDEREFVEGIFREFDLPVGTEEFMRVFQRWLAGLFPGTEDLLGRLARDYRLACLSNLSAVHWRSLGDRARIERHLDQCFISYQFGKTKPDAAAFTWVIDRLDCPPERIAFFDDSNTNVQAAREMGLDAYTVQGLPELREKLISLGILPDG